MLSAEVVRAAGWPPL